jgi:hypothetical protein
LEKTLKVPSIKCMIFADITGILEICELEIRGVSRHRAVFNELSKENICKLNKDYFAHTHFSLRR